MSGHATTAHDAESADVCICVCVRVSCIRVVCLSIFHLFGWRMMTYFAAFSFSAFSEITSSLIFLCSSLEIRPRSRSSLRISSCCCTYERCVYGVMTSFPERRQTDTHTHRQRERHGWSSARRTLSYWFFFFSHTQSCSSLRAMCRLIHTGLSNTGTHVLETHNVFFCEECVLVADEP